MKDLVLYIDEEPASRRVYGRVFREMLPEAIEFEAIGPQATVDRTLAKLSSMPSRIVTLVFDEKLYANGTADFTGTEIVQAYRQLDDKLPIYILTNYVDDVDGWLPGIEYVIDKNMITDAAFQDKLSTRVLRHINIYKDIHDHRTVRFRELVKKSLDASLTKSESEELAELRVWRTTLALAVEEPYASVLKESLDETEAKLQEIERILKDNGC